MFFTWNKTIVKQIARQIYWFLTLTDECLTYAIRDDLKLETSYVSPYANLVIMSFLLNFCR